MALSQRTLRHWLRHPPEAEAVDIKQTSRSPAKPKPPNPRQRRQRFGFDLVLPETQFAADTTDLQAFGVPLKLVAAQDVGARDQELLSSILVDDRESAEHVIHVLTETLQGKPGAQVITDQGTPYLAEATKKAIENLEADHAPQREADPWGKATIERAFGSVKQCAKPLLELTDRIAAKIPALKKRNLAKAMTTLVLVALLRAYQAGARATRRADDTRADHCVSIEQLAEAAQKNRHDARAEMRSKRLFLQHIHALYSMPPRRDDFIRNLRIYPMSVLLQAEKGLRSQIHRDDIRDRCSYYAAIVRNTYDQYKIRVAQLNREQEQEQKTSETIVAAESQQAYWEAHPDQWLVAALQNAAAQWDHERGRWPLGEPVGLARIGMQLAIQRLVQDIGHVPAADVASTVFRDFEKQHRDTLGSDAIETLRANITSLLPKNSTNTTEPRFASEFFSAIIGKTGPPTRPDASKPLRT